MKANNILNRILAELSSIREVKFEQMTLENGAVLEAESFEAGNEVFVLSGEDRVAAPIGEHLLADGRILVITEEGVIAEIKEADAEVAEEVEAQAEEPTELAEVEVIEDISVPEVNLNVKRTQTTNVRNYFTSHYYFLLNIIFFHSQ